MIIVTGAAGFIASCVAKHLFDNVSKDLVLVDDFSNPEKASNLKALAACEKVERDVFFNWVKGKDIEAIVHLGARTDTTEFDYSIFEELNVNYSKRIWTLASKLDVPLIYASSAATYGAGEHGYEDRHDIVSKLNPLNPYGVSKNEFDKWALKQPELNHWYGLKFFNVYGPNEYHKGRMASVILHAHNQITDTGKLKLFRSHNEAYKDGGQLRDFIYVKDIYDIIQFLLDKRPQSGLYNLGTGKARTFLDLANGVFKAMRQEPEIEFIDTPSDIRDKYQYFTEATTSKLRNAGYSRDFTELEQGISDYVSEYLRKGENF